MRDVLAVTVGLGGVRARRTGADGGAADSFVELPDAPTDPSGGASGLVTAVAALTNREGRPPEAVVWVVPDGWYGWPSADLLVALSAHTPGARVAVLAHPFAALVGALGEVRGGTCLDVGAAATILVTDLDGLWHRIDGWGPVLGSRGSGAWLGAQGLAAGLRHRDGVPDGSQALLGAGRAAFGDEAGWPALAAGPDAEARLTSFAPAVAQAAREDPIARAIVREAGESLAAGLAAGRRLLPTRPIVAVGGLLYVEAVRVALASALGRRQLFLVPGLGGALEGARLVGEHLLAGGALPHRPPYVVRDLRGELSR